MAKDEIIDDLIYKHNALCELLDEMKLNPLADFENLKIDEDSNIDEEVSTEEEDGSTGYE